MDPSAFPTVATVIGFTPDADSGPLVATLACPIPSDEAEVPVAGHESPPAAKDEPMIVDNDDPVTKALVDNIVGNLPTKKPVTKLRCDICNIEVYGQAVLDMHLAGAKHFKQMKLVESIAKIEEQEAQESNSTPPNPLLCFKCEACNVSVNSIQQLQVHSQGIKHKNNVANLSQKQSKPPEQEPVCPIPAHSGPTHKKKIGNRIQQYKRLEQEPLQSFPTPSGMAVQKFSCSTCSIDVNSAVQLEQHLSSRRHLDKVSGNVPAITTKNRFESYSTAEVAQPYSQKKFVKRVNRKVVSSRNQNQRFNPYSEESTFQQEIPTGAADGQFSCSVCNINLNSAIQLQQHEASKKHAEKAAGFSSHNNMVEKMKTPNVISSSTSQGSGQTYAFADLRQKRPPLKGAATKSNRGGGSGVGVKNFTCETCNVITNSMVQLQQHYQSLKHIEQIEGKSTSKKEPSFGIPPQTFIKKNTFKNGIIAKKPRGSKSGFTGQNKFSSPSLRQPPDFEPPQQQDFVAPQKPFVASQNQFSSPTVRQISDFVPPQKSDFQSQNNFNSPTMFQTPPPGFLPPQQPVLNRMLNNMKSNSDQDQSAKLFSRF